MARLGAPERAVAADPSPVIRVEAVHLLRGDQAEAAKSDISYAAAPPPPAAVPYLPSYPALLTHHEIDKKTLEIRPVDGDVYSNVQELADELPDHAPRFVLLSYPLTLDSGRLSVPYVMLYYLPVTCNNEVKMLYAGAKELMRNTAEVNKIIEIDSADDLEDIEEKLKGDS
ncbi:hypothetical protein GRF29_154g1325827 [Pseudopithomyces chartarum]|uniref:ADF-H domain-containing protein n=1 Tax=Pseudopithomyces chartarum TaxID=1892770 RepID=A0AAN6LSE8_9PLEO|nr:hypothetical protein GRF29_154g1325827 [Pseudopithomyces chartarum]